MNARAVAWTVLAVGVTCAASTRSVLANTAPQISGTPPTSVMAGQPYSFRPSASDAEQQKLAFSIVNRPLWAAFDPTTGRLQGTPASTYSGITFVGVRISVSDGGARRELPAFDITVKLPNRRPAISGTPLTFVAVGKSYAFSPQASDPERQPLRYTISNKPAWATFDVRSGRLYGAPATRLAGSVTTGVRICVSDGYEWACLPVFQLRVTATNGAPMISGIPSKQTRVGSAYAFRPIAADPNGNSLTFLIQNKPRWATFDASTGRLAGVPDTRDRGTRAANIQIAAFDGYLKTWLPAFAIDVDGSSESGTVTLSWAPPTRNTDGSRLANVHGYQIYYGLAPDRLSHHVFVGGAKATSAVIEGLAPATWYFALRTVTHDSRQSRLSRVVSKRVR